MKLLQKTLRHYLFFSVIIFSVSVPVFYFLTQHLWIVDLDESLVYQKEKIKKGIEKYNLDLEAVRDFTIIAKQLDLEVLIEPGSKDLQLKDSIYYVDYYDDIRGHIEPFRVLQTTIMINNQPYRLLIKKDLVENEDLVRAIAFAQAILFLLLLFSVLLLNNYYAKKTWLPFYNTVKRLKSFKIDREEKFKVEASDITEFKELNDSVLRLTENNIRIFKAQKEFTENAAHETQTPLAVIKTQIDLLSQEDELSSKQAEIITRIGSNLRLLTKLNRNLLLLSKIENKQFNDTEPVEVGMIITEIINAFEEEAELNGISLNINFEGNPKITTNNFLFHSLASNLLANAVKYNVNEGALTVTLLASGIQIINTSSISRLDQEKIYQRFYKNSKATESSGLGLAIAKQICDLLNFTLEYEFHEPNLHQFKVTF